MAVPGGQDQEEGCERGKGEESLRERTAVETGGYVAGWLVERAQPQTPLDSSEKKTHKHFYHLLTPQNFNSYAEHMHAQNVSL